MKRWILVLAAVLLAAAALPGPASAQVLFFDDFNDGTDGQTIAGTTANTGETWSAPQWGGGTFGFGTGTGVGGTLGARKLGSGYSDNWAVLPTPITAGAYILSADLTKNGGGELQLFLQSPGNSKSITFNWFNSNLEIQSLFGPGMRQVPVGWDRGQMHVEMAFDVDNETASISWYDIADPGNTGHAGTQDLGAFTTPSDDGTYSFSNIILFTTVGGGGFDNVKVEVPEPASLALLAVGGLLLRPRRRA